ncbi:MAG: hypothetical protein ABIN01_04930 [Ferruginibacter sp.]
MKIENIIEDIKKDIKELSDRLEEQFKIENPSLNFSVSLPGIEELNTIKSIALTIVENSETYYLSVQIHTHNGNRVFENVSKMVIESQLVPYGARHVFQDRFVDLLRDIIKKQKCKKKVGPKNNTIYNDLLQYANTA